MNILELLITLAVISATMFVSQKIALVARVPSAIVTVLVIGLLAFITKIIAKTPTRPLMFMTGFVTSTALLAIGLACVVGARQPIVMLPVAIAVVFLAVQIDSVRRRKSGSR
jgi:hypothetical protein